MSSRDHSPEPQPFYRIAYRAEGGFKEVLDELSVDPRVFSLGRVAKDMMTDELRQAIDSTLEGYSLGVAMVGGGEFFSQPPVVKVFPNDERQATALREFGRVSDMDSAFELAMQRDLDINELLKRFQKNKNTKSVRYLRVSPVEEVCYPPLRSVE